MQRWTPSQAPGRRAQALRAVRLTPGAWPRTVLSTLSLDGTPLALNALPEFARGEVEVPLTVAAEGHAPGALEIGLSWSGALPDGWTAILEDTETGTQIGLAEAEHYAFTLDVPPVSMTKTSMTRTSATKTSATKTASPAGLGLDLAPPMLRQAEAKRSDAGEAVTTSERFRLLPARATSSEGTAGLAFGLGAPSPNPSRGTLRVPFALDEAGEVHLAVYDALGREVAVLAGGLRQPGAHEARISGAELSAGVYLVRLVAGDRSDVRRVTVVR